jgi:hypothetical protein
VTRCPFCAQPLPCRCGQGAGIVCPKCGGDPHVGMARCSVERRAATERVTRQARQGNWCTVCGHGLDGSGESCLECGAPHPLAAEDRPAVGARSSGTTDWTEAMAYLRRRYVPSE